MIRNLGHAEIEGKGPVIFYGWIVVAVAFVTLGVTLGIWYSYSVFFLAIAEEFAWSKAQASSVFSVFIISQALMGVAVGYLQDRFGPRMVLPFGSVLLTLALVLTSHADSIWYFRFSYGLLGGAGVSFMAFSSHSAFIPKWFERKRGLAVGIAMSGIGFGMLFIIPLAERSIGLFGWRTTYLILAGVVLFFVGPLNLLFSRRQPQDMNLKPDGCDSASRPRIPEPSMTMIVVDDEWANKDWTLAAAVRTKRFWFLVAAFFFASYVYQGILLHAVSAMVDTGLERSVASDYFGLLGIAGSAGKIFFGYLSDFTGRERANTLAGLLTALGIASLLLLSEIQGAFLPLLFALLFGLGYGAAAPLFPSVSADIFLGRSFGAIFAVICIGGGFGGALGSFIDGLLRDIWGDYFLSFALCFLSLFFSCLFIWLASPRKVRKMVKNMDQVY
ncbi:MAG: MFS transporter [Deltaproteobacteria bacterium]|nr:MFS transporter [Deltaproteobacteria bacterium]